MSVLVVAPAVGVTRLQSLTGAVDEARAEAGELAERETQVLPVPYAEVRIEVGDRDPLVAVEDALPRVDAAPEAGEEAAAPKRSRGRSSQIPVVLLAAVGAVVLAAIVVISLIAFLVVWLV